MHHTTMYGQSGNGLDTDGYGQTTISLSDGSSASMIANSEANNNNNCSYFSGQTNVITDSWPTVSYSNGLNPMKQMEGEDNAAS